jgi:hypothetical protein
MNYVIIGTGSLRRRAAIGAEVVMRLMNNRNQIHRTSTGGVLPVTAMLTRIVNANTVQVRDIFGRTFGNINPGNISAVLRNINGNQFYMNMDNRARSILTGLQTAPNTTAQSQIVYYASVLRQQGHRITYFTDGTYTIISMDGTIWARINETRTLDVLRTLHGVATKLQVGDVITRKYMIAYTKCQGDLENALGKKDKYKKKYSNAKFEINSLEDEVKSLKKQIKKLEDIEESGKMHKNTDEDIIRK